MFHHILVPLDESLLAECALPHAATLARELGAQVTLLCVLEHRPVAGKIQPLDPLEWQIIKAEAFAYLNEVRARFEEEGLSVDTALLEGEPAERIIHFARENDIDLLIMSSHGQSGLSSWSFGSIGQKAVMRAHVNLMVVRAHRCVPTSLGGLDYRRLLVPLDGSVRAESVLPVAKRLVRSRGGELLLTRVVVKPEMPRRVPPTAEEKGLVERLTDANRREAAGYLETLTSRLLAEGFEVRSRLLVGEQVDEVLHEVAEREQVDLVMLCAHGYSGTTKWPFGSTVINFLVYGAAPLFILQDLKPHEVEPCQAEVAASQKQGH